MMATVPPEREIKNGLPEKHGMRGKSVAFGVVVVKLLRMHLLSSARWDLFVLYVFDPES